MNEIKRDTYLQRLNDKKENGLIKVITGIRRCGKSYLLFYLYHDYLISQGIEENQILQIPLDDDMFTQYRDPAELSKYIRSKIVDNKMNYIFIDEVQYAISNKILLYRYRIAEHQIKFPSTGRSTYNGKHYVQ